MAICWYIWVVFGLWKMSQSISATSNHKEHAPAISSRVSTPAGYDFNNTRLELMHDSNECDTSIVGVISYCLNTPCYHGRCEFYVKTTGGLAARCDCQTTWSGPYCDRCCSLPCAHGACTWNSTSHQEYCNCHEGYSSQLCDVTSSCNSTEPLPTADPSCSSTLCYHGKCEMVQYIFGGVIASTEQCECEDGWFGSQCDVCCELLCTNNGTCKFNNDLMVCVCTEEYTGELCESLLLDSTTDNYDSNIFSTYEEVEDEISFPNFTTSCNVSQPLPLPDGNCNLACYHGVCESESIVINGVAMVSESCACHENWTGDNCDTCCDLPCVNGGVCETWRGWMECYCGGGNHTGVYCQDLIPTEPPDIIIQNHTLIQNHTRNVTSTDTVTPTWYWWLVGSGIMLVIGLLVLLVILPYIMWRKRSLMIMKLVHFFQKYEDDDDGKLYDAFISYKSVPEDERFVVRRMVYKLERVMKFRLCVHFRDFTIGRPIADNILDAIQKSRRSILIISPDYLKSEWPRLEFQVAQHEMLKLKSKIIPIIYRDISSCRSDLDPNLEFILDSITYIEWPGSSDSKHEDIFWKRLELSMPKKKSTESSHVITHDTYV